MDIKVDDRVTIIVERVGRFLLDITPPIFPLPSVIPSSKSRVETLLLLIYLPTELGRNPLKVDRPGVVLREKVTVKNVRLRILSGSLVFGSFFFYETVNTCPTVFTNQLHSFIFSVFLRNISDGNVCEVSN